MKEAGAAATDVGASALAEVNAGTVVGGGAAIGTGFWAEARAGAGAAGRAGVGVDADATPAAQPDITSQKTSVERARDRLDGTRRG